MLLVSATLCLAQEAPSPPPRPSDDGRLQAIGRALFDAIVHDDPALADAMFFPREPFLKVKAMQDPGRYWDQLHARFVKDIHALHAGMPDAAHAQYERLDLSGRGGYVRPGEEGNRLPYWAARHNVLRYREGNERRTLEVRVLITWNDCFYVIHLSEFH